VHTKLTNQSKSSNNSVRSKLKGIETKERVKLLAKRSLSIDNLKINKHTLANKLNELSVEVADKHFENLEDRDERRMSQQSLDQLKQMKNPMVKFVEDDTKSLKSNRSHHSNASMVSTSKLSNYVRTLQVELQKEKTAKNSALSILRGLKKKEKVIEDAIVELSNWIT